MAHAEHFLSRLERLAPADVEVALSLYRNVAIVKEVLGRAGQEDSERVALALSREPAGPHLVVTGSGAFVTCLGAGMTPGGIAVIPRAVLDAVMTRHENLALADELAGGKGQGYRLVSRVFDSTTPSREEFAALSAFEPALRMRLLVSMLQNLDGLSTLIARSQARGARPALIEAAWVGITAHGTLCALGGLGAREMFAALDADLYEASDAYAVGAIIFGHLPTAVRGLWASARLGKDRLLRAKRRFVEESPRLRIIHAFELAALGLAHTRLAAEALKVLEREEQTRDPVRRESAGALRLVRRILEEPDTMDESLVHVGRQLCFERGLNLPGSSPYHFGSAADVPSELARAAAVNTHTSLWGEDGPTSLTLLSAAVPFLARASAEALFLPAAALAAWGETAFSADRAVAHLESLNEHRAPLKRERPKLSPNAPCVCGSGKKLKRCCQSA